MYVGHAAIALALTRREPRMPIVPLVLAAFGPDWLELLLMLPIKHEKMAVVTHSLPAVLIGGGLAAGLFAATRRPGARVMFLAWLLHWPADLLTGHKPVLFATPLIGLDLYNLPALDFAFESTLVAVGCAIYARSFASRAELRRVVVILGAALIALQAAVDVALSVMRKAEWTPSLAIAGWQPHPPDIRLQAAPRSACILHVAPRTHDARKRWRWTVHGAS